MLSAKIPKKKSVSASFLKPVLPLLPEALPKSEENKSSFITMELKSQAGVAASGTYKKHLALFDEGTPQQWIDTQMDLLEVITQNGIKEPINQLAIVRTVLRGETLTTLDTAVSDKTVDAEGKPVELTPAIFKEVMTEVTKTIFPYKALEIQKQWMRKVMRKPAKLSTRMTAAALSKINNYLILFPGGSEQSKFSPAELLEILECSLPNSWRQKFDYDGYIPSEGTKAQLIMACEAIERSEELSKKDKKRKKKKLQKKLSLQNIKSSKKTLARNIIAQSMGRIQPITLISVLPWPIRKAQRMLKGKPSPVRALSRRSMYCLAKALRQRS